LKAVACGVADGRADEVTVERRDGAVVDGARRRGDERDAARVHRDAAFDRHAAQLDAKRSARAARETQRDDDVRAAVARLRARKGAGDTRRERARWRRYAHEHAAARWRT